MELRTSSLTLFTIFSCIVPLSWGSNGSFGVGSARIPLFNGIAANMPVDSVRVQGPTVVDAKTGEKLIQISQASIPELKAARASARLVDASLGALRGYEFTPKIKEKTGNFWVVCTSQNQCTKLTPLSASNPKVPALIGSLSR